MLACTCFVNDDFSLVEKPVPVLPDLADAMVRVTIGSICSSDLHIRSGSVQRAVPGTVWHEMVGVVEKVGAGVEKMKPGTCMLRFCFFLKCTARTLHSGQEEWTDATVPESWNS